MRLHITSTCVYSRHMMSHGLLGSLYPAVLLRSHSLHAYDEGHVLLSEFIPYWGFSRGKLSWSAGRGTIHPVSIVDASRQ